jgi:hypothetical protein
VDGQLCRLGEEARGLRRGAQPRGDFGAAHLAGRAAKERRIARIFLDNLCGVAACFVVT